MTTDTMQENSPIGLSTGRGRLGPENKVDCTQHAQAGPEVVPFQRLMHVHDGKRDKHDQCNDFLQDFELSQIELRETDAVGRDLKTVFNEGDAPAGDNGNPEWLLM